LSESGFTGFKDLRIYRIRAKKENNPDNPKIP